MDRSEMPHQQTDAEYLMAVLHLLHFTETVYRIHHILQEVGHG